MEIRVLRYFLAIAREGSITNAANYLHVTQPTLSRQIKELEEEVGQKLFIRGSHNMKLTQEGFILRKRAEEIVSMVDKTEAEFRSMESTVAGDIYIGGGETRAISYIADVVRELREKYPDIKYHLHSGNEADVTERLDRGLIDFGILVQPADLTKYDCLHLPAEDIWGVVMRKDSPLAEKPSITRQDLRELPLILSRQAIAGRKEDNEFINWFGSDFDKLNIVTTFNLMYNAAIMVEAGIGYAVGIDGITNTDVNSSLCFRPLEPRMTAGLDVIWKKYQVFTPAAELFLQRLQERYASE
ncbi:LysR family transcriptional regulator [Ruminococcus flavefaciens]|uniref:DNA-binding transcriptional LysR family regulator n=1 Tax=Ruminococcus flavefaciens TaxID=1265 RepID=A0A315XXK3_RUMFL|nr:LysR family transcriptional regulator [Ruminococcus flavefaciens]PWJ11860.1 DNA-binding transcriptional LysR family regulator [Ruminococcus flavefaciens]SSA50047.1 DNA-binding transcriptional regulator, LysR family [Ruminococcus flavefaciens]